MILKQLRPPGAIHENASEVNGQLLYDIKSISIQPSLWGYVSKGLALCGNEQLWHAMEVFDLAITLLGHNPVTVDLLLLIK